MGSWKGGARTGSKRSGWEVRCRQKWAGWVCKRSVGRETGHWSGREGYQPSGRETQDQGGRPTNQFLDFGLSTLMQNSLLENVKAAIGWKQLWIPRPMIDMQDLHCMRAIFVCLYTGRCVNDIEFKQMKPAMLWACCKSYCLELWRKKPIHTENYRSGFEHNGILRCGFYLWINHIKRGCGSWIYNSN